MIPTRAHNDAAILSPSGKRGALMAVAVDTFPSRRREGERLPPIEGEEGERRAVQGEENDTPALYQGDPFSPIPGQ